MYRIPIVKIIQEKDGYIRAKSRKISDPDSVYEIVKAYIGPADREHFVVVMVDARHKLVGINTVAIGTPTSCWAHPREVFKPAILSNAAAIIIAHNHPSGVSKPSNGDVYVSKLIKKAGELLGIPLLDSLVICENSFVSMDLTGVL
jgi:DNA repair protein RadC